MITGLTFGWFSDTDRPTRVAPIYVLQSQHVCKRLIWHWHSGDYGTFCQDCNALKFLQFIYLFRALIGGGRDGCDCIDSQTLPIFFYHCRRGCQSCTSWKNYLDDNAMYSFVILSPFSWCTFWRHVPCLLFLDSANTYFRNFRSWSAQEWAIQEGLWARCIVFCRHCGHNIWFVSSHSSYPDQPHRTLSIYISKMNALNTMSRSCISIAQEISRR